MGLLGAPLGADGVRNTALWAAGNASEWHSAEHVAEQDSFVLRCLSTQRGRVHQHRPSKPLCHFRRGQARDEG